MSKNKKLTWKVALFALVMGGAGMALGYFSATYLKAAMDLLENNPEKAMDFAEKGMAKYLICRLKASGILN